jgi:hypothetical protein
MLAASQDEPLPSGRLMEALRFWTSKPTIGTTETFPGTLPCDLQGSLDWRGARGVLRKQVLSDEVRRVAVSPHEVGREPTLREVAARLTTHGSMREPIAREVLRQIRLELGPVRH